MVARTVSRPVQPGRTMAWAAWTVVLLAVGASPAHLGAPQPQGTAASAAAPEAVLAQTFTAAWNAGDPAAAAALFAPGAHVRHRNAWVVRHGGNVDVSDVYGAALTYEGDPPRLEGDEVAWATGETGEAEIRNWLAGVLPGRRPVDATNYRVAGTTVSWDYRVPVPPHVRRAVPGMPTISGTVEAQVTDGRIARLVLTSAPGVAALREQVLARAVAGAYPRSDAGAPASDRNPALAPPDTQARTTPSPAPVALALALVCLAGTAVLAACTKR